MHTLGYAHSIEVWEEKKLIGGLYGVAIGKVFFAESMYSKSPNGSKIALIALMGILAYHSFSLLDVQFMTSHLKTLGAQEISRSLFLYHVKKSNATKTKFEMKSSCIIDKNLINIAEVRSLVTGVREFKHQV